MEPRLTCLCGKPLPPRHRKYCAERSSLASALWKRAQRRASHGTAYWLDYWLKLAGDGQSAQSAYNAYMRNYMRRYRRSRVEVDEVSYAQ